MNVRGPLSWVREEDLDDASGDRAGLKEGPTFFGYSGGRDENGTFGGGAIFVLTEAGKLEKICMSEECLVGEMPKGFHRAHNECLAPLYPTLVEELG